MDLAAFIGGNVDDQTRRRIAAHVEECDRCIYAIRETARFEREHADSSPLKRLLSIAAGLLLAVVAAGWLVSVWRDPVRRLRATATRVAVREYEGRIAGFDYSRFEARRSSSAPNPSIAAVASAVLSNNSAAPRQWHARGVADLLVGRFPEAVHDLYEATRLAPRSWSYRSDLAAARIALGTDRQDAAEIRRALADADLALQLEPNAPSALFNRAVAFERLGAAPSAARAYDAYLAVDPSSGWAEEARWRLKRLRP